MLSLFAPCRLQQSLDNYRAWVVQEEAASVDPVKHQAFLKVGHVRLKLLNCCTACRMWPCTVCFRGMAGVDGSTELAACAAVSGWLRDHVTHDSLNMAHASTCACPAGAPSMCWESLFSGSSIFLAWHTSYSSLQWGIPHAAPHAAILL